MKLLEKHFEIALETPDGIVRLRELILKIAMQGKLVEQNSNDKSAKELINEITDAKQKFIGKKKDKGSSTPITNDEILFNLPNKWTWCRLNQISEYIQRGKGPVYSEIEEIPVISQKCIQWSGFNKDIVKFISPKSIDKYHPERFIRKGDLLWNSTGTGTLGRINIYNDELKNFSKVVADSHVTVVRPIIVNSFYILNFLKSPYVQDTIEANASGTTNQIELNTSTVMNQVIPLPPLEEQQRIVEKIDQLMLLCDKLESERNSKNKLQLQINSAAINNLIKANDEISFNNSWSFIANQFDTLYSVKQNVTDLKNIIYELASRGKIVNQNNNDISVEEQIKIFNNEIYYDDKSIKVKSSKINIQVNETPFEIPNNWKWMRLKDFAIYNGRPNMKPAEIFDDTWVLDLEDIEKDTSRLLNKISNLERQSKSTKSSFKNGDVLYGKLRPYLNKVIIADDDGVCTTEIVPIVPSKLIISEYLKILLKRSTFLNHVNGLSYGVKMPRLGTNDAEMSIHPIPPLAEQYRIVKKVNQLFELCDTLEKNLEQSSQKQSQILNAVLAQV